MLRWRVLLIWCKKISHLFICSKCLLSFYFLYRPIYSLFFIYFFIFFTYCCLCVSPLQIIRYQGRRLQWAHAHQRCVLTARFPKGKKELEVSLFQVNENLFLLENLFLQNFFWMKNFFCSTVWRWLWQWSWPAISTSYHNGSCYLHLHRHSCILTIMTHMHWLFDRTVHLLSGDCAPGLQSVRQPRVHNNQVRLSS